METMTFDREQVLNKLKENREAHLTIVREAQGGYRTKLIAKLEALLEDARAGKEVAPHVGLSVPANHLDEYDNAIEMLEWTSDSNIELSPGDFQCFIRNKWIWERDFLVSNSAYSESAAEASRSL